VDAGTGKRFCDQTRLLKLDGTAEVNNWMNEI
jgi:hypothetical protein